MDLNAFYWFVKVVEAKSMTKAAKLAGCAVSSISDRIKQLEQQLGARLLERSTRSLRLTEEGEAFYEQARLIVESAEAAQIAVSAMRNEPSGLLTVSVPPEFTRSSIWSEFRHFAQRYPKVKMRLLADIERANLLQESVDLAIRVGFLEDNRLVARKISKLKMVIVADESYLKSLKTPINCPADLANVNCIPLVNLRDGKVWPWTFMKGELKETLIPQGNFEVSTLMCGLDGALNGMGVAIVPDILLSVDDRKKLIGVLPDWKLPSSPVWAVYPSKHNLAPKVQAFIAVLQAAFGVENK